MAKDHGPSVKDDKQYEGLRKKGMSKGRAAAIANTPDASRKAKGTRRREVGQGRELGRVVLDPYFALTPLAVGRGDNPDGGIGIALILGLIVLVVIVIAAGWYAVGRLTSRRRPG